MPSQIPTTFGSYATAPMVRVSSMTHSEQRDAEERLADELAEHVHGRRHDRACVSIAEVALDGGVLGERGATARMHGAGGHPDRRLAGSGLHLQHAEHRL